MDNGGDYTYEVDNRKSINDYIILSDNILLPSVATNDTDDVQNEHKSNNIMNETYSIPMDSLYERKSFKIRNDYRIGDHYLLTCNIQLSTPVAVPYQSISLKHNIPHWIRHYDKKSEYWTPMKEELQKYLCIWDQQVNVMAHDTNNLVNSFSNYINTALSNSLESRNNKKGSKVNINWDPRIYKLTC